MCDCDNPDCQLSPGRCGLCENPCESDTPADECLDVCAACSGRVLDLYDREWRTDVAVEPDSEGPGWRWADEMEDGSRHIERDDSYASDADAFRHVRDVLLVQGIDGDRSFYSEPRARSPRGPPAGRPRRRGRRPALSASCGPRPEGPKRESPHHNWHSSQH